MKKFMKFGCLGVIGLIALIVVVAVFSTGGEDTETSGTNQGENQSEETTNDQSSSEDEDAAEEASSEETYSVGDTAEVDGVQFTLKSVTTTDERNEFAETDPSQVVKVEYEIVNNKEDEISVGGDLQAYDGTGNQVESYPLDNTMGSLQPGKKIQGVEHFGIEEGPIEIYFQPLVSFEDPAIFTAEVQ
ncbi:DUF4352 domain-containing protein [Virgibacillus sediminis]|uniref:DUF4352 domain-containing protein n=1 Tax=Virgibacillus sediminis TaxID=202260 RepID=A0ABV7A6D7_9BACI